ncbi:MAG: DUF2203 family protein [Candidatus Omnitrophica bacterium]|nr:DUF2203 family protein [Candidatus Omnitrophota bacterium]
MKYKVFSIEDANALVPTLKPLLIELAEKKSTMSKMHDALLTMELLDENNNNFETESGQEYLRRASSLENLIVSFETDLKQIAEYGCVLRDIEKGVVDFYHVYGKELVFLNWMNTDEDIQFWYELDSHYRNRLPLTDLKKRT